MSKKTQLMIEKLRKENEALSLRLLKKEFELHFLEIKINRIYEIVKGWGK